MIETNLKNEKLLLLLSGYITLGYPPLLVNFDYLKGGVARLNFSEKKIQNFFHIFSCAANENIVKICFFSNTKNIFRVLTETKNYNT